MKTVVLALLWGTAVSVLSVRGDAIYVPVPADIKTHPGNAVVPFSEVSQTYQQVFDSSVFSSFAPNGFLLQAVEFRGSPNTGPTTGKYVSYEIEFSTTSKAVDSLSPVFAENLGSDNQVFWGGRPVDFQNAKDITGAMIWSPAFGVLPRDAFLYDPAKGNLLMTIHGLYLPPVQGLFGFDAIKGSHLTASVGSGDSGERGTLRSDALVVLFGGTVIVPEPSLAIPALLALGLAWRLRRSKLPRKEAHVPS